MMLNVFAVQVFCGKIATQKQVWFVQRHANYWRGRCVVLLNSVFGAVRRKVMPLAQIGLWTLEIIETTDAHRQHRFRESAFAQTLQGRRNIVLKSKTRAKTSLSLQQANSFWNWDYEKIENLKFRLSFLNNCINFRSSPPRQTLTPQRRTRIWTYNSAAHWEGARFGLWKPLCTRRLHK